MRYLMFILYLGMIHWAGAQDKVYEKADSMPEYPGGEKALQQYLESTPYSPISSGSGIQGTVFVRFVIDTAGSVTDEKVEAGAHELLNQYALKRIREMPKWRPGYHKGVKVNVSRVVRITFKDPGGGFPVFRK